ncbi:bifunctional metallophosphatase/5'-nucleotidase [Undibacterium sp. Jales W-56]|uniref:bifunctional metallophosphatase/5'-nucleotidase n=1 Tax=Undibacterium sp. Jales W-56 TaxID=2897325 RepID=UPI0021D3252B|nr:bifunctional metallophosphatase/5'-nucleotidase [Undibacterium sp. Jales W-56]MCU6434855.1 bifunctional metallophosphatase/5'-nucleotidase [Undibacterium sp. Jales W-56]
MFNIKSAASLLTVLLMTACAMPKQQLAGTTEITIFSINDFHGNLQSDKPIPYLAPVEGLITNGKAATKPAGGYAYLASILKDRRKATSASILVGAGDLIGASPIGSSILKDEPVIEGLNQLGLDVSAVGNHEFDGGRQDLQRKMNGDCPASGCEFPGFKGARFDYIAANVIDKASARPWLKPYVIRQVGDIKVAFIGAVTSDTPNLVSAEGIKTLQFDEEANAINRFVPEIKAQGVAVIVVLIHEGAYYAGAANDPTYRCEGLKGPIIDITRRLDKAVTMVVSGHTHQGYTCKIDGRLLVQARSYGAYLTETKLTIDRQSNQVLSADARNYLVDQGALVADPIAQQLVDQVAALTTEIRQRVVTKLNAPLTRSIDAGGFDSALGNVIADAQLQFGLRFGAADVSFMNAGGIRSDLPSVTDSKAVEITFGDIYAVQPFGNELVSMSLTGEQIHALLQQQWSGRAADDPKILFVSNGFSYRWNPALAISQRIQDLRLHGQPIQATRSYKVIVNKFLADGGDGFSVFKQGQQRQIIGHDLEALEVHVQQQGSTLSGVKKDRVMRSDAAK